MGSATREVAGRSRQRINGFAFTKVGVSLGLQAVGVWEERVGRLNDFFTTYRSGDEYDREAITHVMACASRLPGAWVRTAA
jgi:hypothetical protein